MSSDAAGGWAAEEVADGAASAAFHVVAAMAFSLCS